MRNTPHKPKKCRKIGLASNKLFYNWFSDGLPKEKQVSILGNIEKKSYLHHIPVNDTMELNCSC